MNILNTGEYIKHFLHIKTKTNEIIPFRLNRAQRRLYDVIGRMIAQNKPVRVIILKARQLGFSTLAEAIIFHRTATRHNVDSMIIAHTEESTNNLFSMSRLFYDCLPERIKPMLKNSNAKELRFENPTRDPQEKHARPGLRSRIRCVTAGGKGIGRSYTLTNVHISEYAYWQGEKQSALGGLLQAVPPLPGTFVAIESTANGYEHFKALWDAAVSGESDFTPVFFPWFEMDEYRMTVPPGTQWSEAERELQALHGLDERQLAWRRWCIKNNCGGDERLFRQEYPSTPDEAFLTSGAGVFDNEAIALLRERVKAPVKVGRFTFKLEGDSLTDIEWREEKHGPIRIYMEPEKGFPYVIGGDTAGEGSDWFAGQALRNTDGAQVAVLHHKFDETMYARQMYCLGRYYNDALIGIEANYSTYPVRELERLGYPRQYVREAMDDYTHALRKSYGFMTTSRTRPVIVETLGEVMREAPGTVADHATLGEMLTFVYDGHRRAQAQQGAHDDLVMALAIAHYIRPQHTTGAPSAEGKKVKWRDDQYEDYYGADAEGKKYLLGKWGNPF